MVINYDLPWNPQRIEQRIGRCHRYGQKHDVVVVNFLNKKNAADQRVYQLLDEKFKLFSGVFGASDEVLGSIGSGIDFEKRISDIYQKCRTEEQIQFNFDQLQQEMEIQIDERIKQTRQKLLENFDEEVHEKLRINDHESNEVKSKFDHWLWELTRFYLQPYAKFEDGEPGFTLIKNPFPDEQIHPGPYRSGKNVEDANLYRLGHPLAQKIIEQCKAFTPDSKALTFDYSHSGKKISILEPLVGKERVHACHLPNGYGARNRRFRIFRAVFVTMALRSIPNSAADSSPLAHQNSRHRALPYPNISVPNWKSRCGFSRTKRLQS